MPGLSVLGLGFRSFGNCGWIVRWFLLLIKTSFESRGEILCVQGVAPLYYTSDSTHMCRSQEFRLESKGSSGVSVYVRYTWTARARGSYLT
jgi:hypothetical protein